VERAGWGWWFLYRFYLVCNCTFSCYEWSSYNKLKVCPHDTDYVCNENHRLCLYLRRHSHCITLHNGSNTFEFIYLCKVNHSLKIICDMHFEF
jgi:hypothetical protein